jgi:hypothetical protein
VLLVLAAVGAVAALVVVAPRPAAVAVVGCQAPSSQIVLAEVVAALARRTELGMLADRKQRLDPP